MAATTITSDGDVPATGRRDLDCSDHDFIEGEGLPFLAHLLKRISDEFVRGCSEWFPEAGLTMQPRCASTIRVLHKRGPSSITQIAETIRQSHPLVINWVRELKALGLVGTAVDPKDRRRTIVSLTPQGIREAELSRAADQAIAAAYRDVMAEANADVLAPLWRIEHATRNRSFEQRLRDAAAALG